MKSFLSTVDVNGQADCWSSGERGSGTAALLQLVLIGIVLLLLLLLWAVVALV